MDDVAVFLLSTPFSLFSECTMLVCCIYTSLGASEAPFYSFVEIVSAYVGYRLGYPPADVDSSGALLRSAGD